MQGNPNTDMKDKSTTPQDDEPVSNAFEDMLRKHRRGIVANKASEALREAIQASRDTGANSEVTLKIKLLPAAGDEMSIDIQVTSKLPVEKLPSGRFWVDDDLQLHTSDPKQLKLNLREVEKPADRSTIRVAKNA